MSSLQLRRYSYALPWNSSNPLLTATFITPPGVRPNSAENELVWTLNSRMRSTDGITAVA